MSESIAVYVCVTLAGVCILWACKIVMTITMSDKEEEEDWSMNIELTPQQQSFLTTELNLYLRNPNLNNNHWHDVHDLYKKITGKDHDCLCDGRGRKYCKKFRLET